MKKVAAISAIALAMSMGWALAADLPSRKAPVYVPLPPPLVWTGFYAGLNLGGGWSSNNNNQGSAYWDPNWAFGASGILPQPGTPNLFFLPNSNQNNGSNGGVVGGGQVGYNFQFNPSIVIGAEADFQGSSISSNNNNSGASFYPSPFFTPGTTAMNGILVPVSAINNGNRALNWIGTVRGRAGWLFNPSMLVYGTAGFAFGGVQAWGYNDTRTGWTAGGGLEWMFAPRWSATVEYLYVDLSSGGNNNNGFGWNWGYRFHPQANIVRAGVNYHFNWAEPVPVLAKY
jgi:outer membrane immunogenic protein